MEQVVQLWSMGLDQPAGVVARLARLLSADEQARAQRFYFDRDRRRYTVGRGLLRLILSHQGAGAAAALAFTYNQWGKPDLAALPAGCKLSFNLSHTGDRGLCAVADGAALGVDLEELRPVEYAQLAATVFSPVELAAFHAVPPEHQPLAFFHGWTRKEAYIKAHGQGLSMPLTDFDVTLAPDQPARLLATRPDPTEAQRWSLYGWIVDATHVAALAIAGHGWHLSHHDSGDLL